MPPRDTVHLDVSWRNLGVANMTQSTVWVSGWGIEIPWVGMATEAPSSTWAPGAALRPGYCHLQLHRNKQKYFSHSL